MSATDIHATAIVIGAAGYLFIGPSGSGKTSTALACIASARRRGLHAGLVSDDRVLVSAQSGRVVARPPSALCGRAELRGADIVLMDCVGAAVIDHAVRPVSPPFAERLAPESERFVAAGICLPLLRLPLHAGSDPLEALLLLSALRT